MNSIPGSLGNQSAEIVLEIVDCIPRTAQPLSDIREQMYFISSCIFLFQRPPGSFRRKRTHSHAVAMKSSAVMLAEHRQIFSRCFIPLHSFILLLNWEGFFLLVCVVFWFIGGRIECDLAKQTVTSEVVPHSDDSCWENQEYIQLSPNSGNHSQPCL